MTVPPTLIVLQRPAWDAITASGMLVLVGVMSLAWLGVLHKRSLVSSVWGAVALLAVFIANVMGDQWGLFSRLDLLPPPFMLLVLLTLGLAAAVSMGYVGSIGDTLVHTVSIEALVTLQTFRLPLELLMLRAADLSIMPMEFSMLGYNLDVLTGIGALLICIYCMWTRSLPVRAIWLWNILGICCLVVIGALAALTSPNLHAFGANANHINSWVLYFPYSLLPTVLVSMAVSGHVLLTRKLLAQRHI